MSALAAADPKDTFEALDHHAVEEKAARLIADELGIAFCKA